MTQKLFTIDQALDIAAILNGAKNQSPDIAATETGDGRMVIVRSRDAGVLYGEYAGREGANVSLRNAVQMWLWHAEKGGTLVDCAIHGVKADKCRFSVACATVTVFNACALIDCSEDGAASLRKVVGGAWK